MLNGGRAMVGLCCGEWKGSLFLRNHTAFCFCFFLQSLAMVMKTKPEAERLLGGEAQALDMDRKWHHCKMRIRSAWCCHLIPGLQSALLNLR